MTATVVESGEGPLEDGQPGVVTTGAPHLTHIDALDGLRGIAVAGVLAFHLGYLKGGYLGVDLFFVLSGFLITSLLVAEWGASGAVALGRFWVRRARRLLPAMLLVLLAVALYGWLLAGPLELERLRDDGLATLLYAANWHSIVDQVSYWQTFAAPSLLAHTWSLAIEEQFYLLWPLLVVLVLRVLHGSLRVLLGLTLAMAAASAVTMIVLHHAGDDPTRVYFGTDTRAASILVGAALALVLAIRGPIVGRHLGRAVGALGIVAAAFLVVCWTTVAGTSDWLYEGGLFLCGMAVVAIIASIVRPAPGVLGAVLSVRVLRWLGTISYGLYLWHWPVIVVLDEQRTGLDGLPLAVLRVTVSIGIAVASYVWVERPIRYGSLGRTRSIVLLPTSFAVCALSLVLVARGAPALPGPIALPTIPLVTTPSGSSAPTTVSNAATTTVAGGRPVAVIAPLRLMVAGDSGAYYLGEGLASETKAAGGEVSNLGAVGCGINGRTDPRTRMPGGQYLTDPPGCSTWAERWSGEVARFKPNVSLLTLAWPGYGDRMIDGTWRHPCDPVFDRWYAGEAQAAVRALSSPGNHVVVALTAYSSLPLASDAHQRVDCLNDAYRAGAVAAPGTTIVDVNAFVCPAGTCITQQDGTTLRPDGVHFQGPGALLAARWLLPSLTPDPLPAASTTTAPPDTTAPATTTPVAPLRTLVLGDSTAYTLAAGFPASSEELQVAGAASVGCGIADGEPFDTMPVPVPAKCRTWRTEWTDALQRFQPRVVVLMLGAWEVLDHRVNGVVYSFPSPGWHAVVDKALTDAVTLAASTNAELAVLEVPCYHQSAHSSVPAQQRNELARVDALNDQLRQLVAANPRSALVPVGDLVCRQHPTDDLRYDGVHLSAQGAATVWSWLTPRLQALVASPPP